jgi:hypothetical protein
LTEDSSGLSHFARALHQGNERSETHREAEDRATAIGSAVIGAPVEVSIGSLQQAGRGELAVGTFKVMQRGQRSRGGNFEDRAASARGIGAPAFRCSVEITVGRLNKNSNRPASIRATGQRAESVERG